MRTRWGMTGTNLGVAAFEVAFTIPPMTPPNCPPGMPPGTPPTTPPPAADGGGATSSLIISTLVGILLGVRSAPVESTSVSSCRTTFCTAAAGGGGGGGGGGATRNVSNCALGRSSVNSNGIISIRPTATQLKTKDVVVAKALRLRVLPKSSRLSENMTRGANAGAGTSSLRGSTAAPARLADLTSFTSGSWISVVPIGTSLPHPFTPKTGSGRCLSRYIFLYLHGHLRPRVGLGQRASVTAVRDRNHELGDPAKPK